MRKSFRLTYAVLASSVFVVPFAFADATITALNTPAPVGGFPYTSTADGNVEVTPAGQINANATDGYQFNSATKALIVDANNSNVGIAVFSSGGSAVAVLPAGKSATITNNVGSTIQSTVALEAAVEVGGDLTTITNNGTLKGLDYGVHVLAGGSNLTLNNTGGTITTTAPNSIAVYVDVGSSGMVLNNSMNGVTPGLIVGAATGSAIRLDGSFSTITNSAGSTISGFDAISISSAVTGEIINSGTITGTADGVDIAKNFNGSVTNNASGIIQTVDGYGVNIISSSYNAVNNAGTIQATGNGFGIRFFGNSPGSIINSGKISTTGTGNPIVLETNSSTTSITNSGEIISTGGSTGAIFANGNVTVANGIINTGKITGTIALNLDAAGNVIPVFQNGGTITGQVRLAGGANSLTMTGGTINGTVNTTSSAPSTISISGGVVTGPINLLNAGNTFNFSGGTLTTINSTGAGNNIFNILGGTGTFTQINGLAGDVLNVKGTYSSPVASIIDDIDTINIESPATFTSNGTITDIDTSLTIKSGATMIANGGAASVTGAGALAVNAGGTFQINNGSSVNMDTATNLGNIRIFDNASLDLASTYNQTGSFSPTMQNMSLVAPKGFGQINAVGNATFNAGATIAPQLGTGEFILNNYPFPVITSGGVFGFGNINVVQPPSAILSFSTNLNGNTVELISKTNSLASVALPDIPLAIANGLDPLVPTTLAQVAALNRELLRLFGQLQILPDIQSVSNALAQLSPGYNNALPMSSRISMDNAFDTAHARLESMTRLGLLSDEANNNTNRDYELFNGVNYGDRNVITLIGQYGLWAKGTATTLDQHKRNFVEGYKAESTGIAMGFDWQPNEFSTVGIAESYTKTNTKDYTDQQNAVNINSLQTTAYSTFVPYQKCQENSTQTIYLDTMLAIASHKYQTVRNIVIGNINAQSQAAFYGWHYGAQADLGYAFVSADNYLVAPVARFRYTYLDVADYTEYGAGGMSLTVKNDPIDEAVAGLGIRLALKRDFIQAIYVPEFSVFLLYDFAGQAQEMQSNFLGGGGSFYVNSQRPAQYIQQYGAGITAYTSDGYAFNIKGNLEHRDVFFGYNIYAKLTYSWG